MFSAAALQILPQYLDNYLFDVCGTTRDDLKRMVLASLQTETVYWDEYQSGKSSAESIGGNRVANHIWTSSIDDTAA